MSEASPPVYLSAPFQRCMVLPLSLFLRFAYTYRVRVKVRVTELVYQIGFTALFRSQGRGNILAAAAASSSSKQQQQAAASSSKQATELICAYPHISVSIDGTSPKLSWYIVLIMPHNHTKFQVKTHQGAGSVGKKV